MRGGARRDVATLAREIRGAGYSAVVDLHSNARSVFLSRRSGAHQRSRYRKREFSDSVRVRFLRGTYRASKRIVERYLDALEPLGIPHAYRRPRFHVEPRFADGALEKRRRLGLTDRPFAVVVPGSVWPTKRWPVERYASLSRRLVAELGLGVVVVGSGAERALCARVAESDGASSLAGELSLGETAALISSARLFVGNDSGPTHVSMALDVPTVALFGPTDPAQFDFEGHALVHEGLGCSACSFFGGPRCRLGHWNCMLAMDVDRVFSTSRDLLDRRSQA